MDMVERYIAAVQRELPEHKRDDIGRELRANLLDQLEALEAKQGELQPADISNLLQAMGHPRDVAITYYPPKPLVSASYMRLYFNTLFMVLGVLFVIAVVKITGVWLKGSLSGIIPWFFAVLRAFLESAYFAFTAITIGFAVISRSQSANEPKQCQWRPDKLPAAGNNWQYIKLSSVFSELATLLFLVMVVWYPLWQGQQTAVFTPEALTILIGFTPIVIIAVAHCLWQLRVRLWSRWMLWVNVALNVAFFGVALWLTQYDLIQLDVIPDQNKWAQALVQHSSTYILIGIAAVAGYEIVRDAWRLRRI